MRFLIMYIQDVFKIQDQAIIDEFILKNSFAIMISQTSDYPFATHLPLLYDTESHVLYGHLGCTNTHLDYLQQNSKVLVIFSGEHCYISPTWIQNQFVPTWNFTAVHAYGIFKKIESSEKTQAILSQLTDKYESKDGWKTDFSQENQAKLLNHIISFEIKIERFEAKFKLSQNRSIQKQELITEHLEKSSDYNDIDIGKLMRFNLK